MPVQSEKQRRFMYASLAGKTDVSPSVAKKFVGPKAHAEGGSMKESKEMMGKELAFMKAKKAPKSMIKHEKAEAKGKGYAKGGGIESKGKTKGKMVKMAMGGKAC
jgi:acyl CoA:acetate/3-ketoacid CoA transferase alpha subunit